MKKLLLIASACTILAACAKETSQEQEIQNVVPFVKGQEVTLNIAAGTKVVGILNASTDDIDFVWEEGDEIKVTVGSSSAKFVLKEGAGQSYAVFQGMMPESGDTFSVQYPYDGVSDSALTTQTYSADYAIPHAMMLATATDRTLGEVFELSPQFAAVKLNLYGGARSVSAITITNTATSQTYTLNCNPAVTVGKDLDSATPFCVVLPALQGSDNFSFSAAVTANALTPSASNTLTYPESGTLGVPFPAQTTFTTTNHSLSAGTVLNMAAVSLTTVWAPENCGYSSSVSNETKGKFYQWGRFVGSYWNTTTQAATGSSSTTTVDNPADNVFYVNPAAYSTNGCDWRVNKLSAWPMKSTDAGYIAGKVANPCPNGWRVPTIDELGSLCYTDYNPSTKTGTTRRSGNIVTSPLPGWEFTQTGTSSLRFVHSGSRAGAIDGTWAQNNSAGTYFSSTVSGNYAYAMVVATSNERRVWIDSEAKRANGFSVRCVQQ